MNNKNNTIKVYALEWHNRKNYTNKFFGEDYENAKKKYDECYDKDSFTYLALLEITYIGKKAIFNKEKLIQVLSGYDVDYRYPHKILFEKEISNNNKHPQIDTTDLANLIM